MNRAFDGCAVVERSVRRAKILQEILVAFAAHFGMDARRKRIGDTEIVPGGAADSYAQAPEWEVIRGAIGVFNNELGHSFGNQQ